MGPKYHAMPLPLRMVATRAPHPRRRGLRQAMEPRKNLLILVGQTLVTGINPIADFPHLLDHILAVGQLPR